jgi:hypothetical protein
MARVERTPKPVPRSLGAPLASNCVLIRPAHNHAKTPSSRRAPLTRCSSAKTKLVPQPPRPVEPELLVANLDRLCVPIRLVPSTNSSADNPSSATQDYISAPTSLVRHPWRTVPQAFHAPLTTAGVKITVARRIVLR